MMTDSEKLNIIISEIRDMKADMQGMKAEIKDVSRRVDGIELHLENETDKNIQLLAENFIELTNKLNQAIPAADKNLAYEVKVNYLVGRVNDLEKDMTELKARIPIVS